MKMIELSKSQEDYLEAILLLSQKNGEARVKEIATYLKVKMPSVTGALKTLANKQLINHDKNASVQLSMSGEKIAQRINRKHLILKDFLSKILNLPDNEAEKNACLIEHIIDMNTAHRIDNLNQMIQKNHFPLLNSDEWENRLTMERK